MRKLFLIIGLCFATIQLQAQELKCTVSVNSDQITSSNKQVFTTLENNLNEILNQTKFTDYNYKLQERIICNFTIIITKQDGNNFEGSIQIQASRPVYDANFQSPIFNFRDTDFSFQYIEYQPLVYNRTRFESNLVSVMAYYAFVILGMDAATFSEYGGIPFFTQAQNIVVLSQQSGYSGWNQNDGPRTRFKLVDNLLSPAYQLFHQAMYKYHRHGLDNMTTNPKLAKENIAESINELKSLFDARPAAFPVRVFMDAKADEIVDVFSGGPNYDTYKLKENLMNISPLNSEKWNLIK